MLIGGAEGAGYRYEVLSLADGYLVQMRDLQTGATEAGEARLFRTAPVAFALAQTMAAIDRFAATLLSMHDAASERMEARRCEAMFATLKAKFADEGCGYAPSPEPARARVVYH